MLGLLWSDYSGQAGARVITGSIRAYTNLNGVGLATKCVWVGPTRDELQLFVVLGWLNVREAWGTWHGSAFLGEVPMSTRHGCGICTGFVQIPDMPRQSRRRREGRERERGVLTVSRRRWRWSITAAAAESSSRCVSSDCRDSFRVLLYFLLWAMVGLGQHLYCIAFLH